jgi:hypothetical protein
VPHRRVGLLQAPKHLLHKLPTFLVSHLVGLRLGQCLRQPYGVEHVLLLPGPHQLAGIAPGHTLHKLRRLKAFATSLALLALVVLGKPGVHDAMIADQNVES